MASPGTHGAEPMKEGLWSPSPRLPLPRGHLDGRPVSDSLYSVPCKICISEEVWGGGCWGRGRGGGVGVEVLFGPYRPLPEKLPPFFQPGLPAAQAPPPSRDPGSGSQGEPDPGQGSRETRTLARLHPQLPRRCR